MVLLGFGCRETGGRSTWFEAYGVPEWSMPASGKMGVYKCEGCVWLGGCAPSVSCMMESGSATGVVSFEMGDTWSEGDVGAWWLLPEPLEAMVEVW